EHGRTNSDALRALGDAGEMHPYVVAKSRNLRRPYALVAELLREHSLVEPLRAWHQAEGISQRHIHSMPFELKQPGDPISTTQDRWWSSALRGSAAFRWLYDKD